MKAKDIIHRVEARIADRRDELEVSRQSQMVSEVLNSEIAFLEALLAELRAMAD
jgi:hypothetical protein